jgi:hypothetical protein
MRDKVTLLARGVALLALVVGLAVPGIGLAGRGDENDKDHKGKKEQEQSEQFRSQRDDRQTTGQVLDINTLKDPPEMWIGNTDGVVHVRLLTTDLIAKNGVRLGDYVTLTGEKVSEVEFDCQDLSVDAHFGEGDNDNDS